MRQSDLVVFFIYDPHRNSEPLSVNFVDKTLGVFSASFTPQEVSHRTKQLLTKDAFFIPCVCLVYFTSQSLYHVFFYLICSI